MDPPVVDPMRLRRLEALVLVPGERVRPARSPSSTGRPSSPPTPARDGVLPTGPRPFVRSARAANPLPGSAPEPETVIPSDFPARFPLIASSRKENEPCIDLVTPPAPRSLTLYPRFTVFTMYNVTNM